MSISVTTTYTKANGNGSTTAFPFLFKAFASSEVKVYLITRATGVEALKTITTHYTLSLNSGEGGTVTMLTAPESTEDLYIEHESTYSQTTDLEEDQRFDEASLEERLDRLTTFVNQLARKSLRSFMWTRAALGTFSGQPEIWPGDGAGKLLSLNDAGDALAWLTPDDIFDVATGSFSAQINNPFTNGQAATDLDDVALDSGDYTSGFLIAEIVRDTSSNHLACLGIWRLQYANSAWVITEVLSSGDIDGGKPAGVTLTITGTTTAQLQLASSTVAGTGHVGTIKTKLLRFSA